MALQPRTASTSRRRREAEVTAHVDAVCGMQVEEGKAAFSVVCEGKKFYFCGTSCKDKFVAEPKRFAAGKASSGTRA